jgi:hypothetical protein
MCKEQESKKKSYHKSFLIQLQIHGAFHSLFPSLFILIHKLYDEKKERKQEIPVVKTLKLATWLKLGTRRTTERIQKTIFSWKNGRGTFFLYRRT